MAQFEFWAKLDKPSEIVTIPDSELEGLDAEEIQKKLLSYHVKWSEKQLYGDWIKMPET